MRSAKAVKSVKIGEGKYQNNSSNLQQDISELEEVCLSARASLLEGVKLRQDASDMVFILGTQKQLKECPVPFADAITDVARDLQVLNWDPVAVAFSKSTLVEWLDGPLHLMTTLIITGQGGLGKSKLLHTLAQELCIAHQKDTYVFGKSIDALGVLSYAGVVRRSGVLMLTDFDARMARGNILGPEALKSLFDVVEGGSIQDTRYRPAMFPPGLPRIIAVNESEDSVGEWFERQQQYGIGMALRRLSDHTQVDPVEWAAVGMASLGADQQAATRRVAFAFCPDGEFLIREELRAALMQNTKATAEAARARRTAHWEAQDSIA